MAAKGETRGLVALLTAAGISDRNVRYGELIARREARKEAEPVPEPPNPIREATDALRWDQMNLFRLLLDSRLEEAQQAGESEPAAPLDDEQQTAALLAFIADLAALSPERVAERIAELGPVPPAEPLNVTVLDAPTGRERWMVNVTPEPATEAVPRAPSPPVTALEAGEHLEDHPSWRPLE